MLQTDCKINFMNNKAISNCGQESDVSHDFKPDSKGSTRPYFESCEINPSINLNCSEPFTRRRPLSLRIVLKPCDIDQFLKDESKASLSIQVRSEKFDKNQSFHIPQKSDPNNLLSVKSNSRRCVQKIQQKPSSSKHDTSAQEDLSCGGWDSCSQLSKASINSLNCRSGMISKRLSFCKPPKPSGDKYVKPCIKRSPIFDSSTSYQDSSPSKVTLNLTDSHKPAATKKPRISCLINLRSAKQAPVAITDLGSACHAQDCDLRSLNCPS